MSISDWNKTPTAFTDAIVGLIADETVRKDERTFRGGSDDTAADAEQVSGFTKDAAVTLDDGDARALVRKPSTHPADGTAGIFLRLGGAD